MNDDQLERLGQLADRLDNYAAAGAIPMPDHIRLAAINEAIPEMRDELKAVLREAGFDPWGDE
ncbi:hypothetical protein [Stenotrophomonas sp. UBA7606]|uniref:hypothetical protein n=1 Tax=Stenotrophomonas sp. UBA7606 TaxID=1947559 RepID=UPI0025EDC431|nr:hypothetical protein [Stenotrophomonas sp. UBA7606]